MKYIKILGFVIASPVPALILLYKIIVSAVQALMREIIPYEEKVRAWWASHTES